MRVVTAADSSGSAHTRAVTRPWVTVTPLVSSTSSAPGAGIAARTGVVPVAGWEVAGPGTPRRRLLRGGSGVARILGPDGRDLVVPLDEDAEGLLVADLIVATGRDRVRPGHPPGARALA